MATHYTVTFEESDSVFEFATVEEAQRFAQQVAPSGGWSIWDEATNKRVRHCEARHEDARARQGLGQ